MHAPRLGPVARALACAAFSLTLHRRVAAESLIASSAAETAHRGPSPSRVEHTLQILSEALAALTAPIDLLEVITDVGDTGVQRAAA